MSQDRGSYVMTFREDGQQNEDRRRGQRPHRRDPPNRDGVLSPIRAEIDLAIDKTRESLPLMTLGRLR